MKTYILIADTGYGHSIETIVSAETAGKAKYKAWLKSASDAGYWDNFFLFCMYCKAKVLKEGAVKDE